MEQETDYPLDSMIEELELEQEIYEYADLEAVQLHILQYRSNFRVIYSVE